MKKYETIYYIVNSLYNLGVAVWNGTIYIFMHYVGYSYGEINLFLSIFWLVTFFSEIPFGYIADHFGYLRTVQISGAIRAAGLIILACSSQSLLTLFGSGILTALGDSLMSGTMDSWIANKAKKYKQKSNLGKIYSTYNFIYTPLNILAGFIGASYLANIDLKLPLLVGAVFLTATSLLLFLLMKYDSVNVVTHKIEKIDFINDIKVTVTQELSTFKLMILFLPIGFITYGPIDQWQLYFQHGKQVKIGSILIAINCIGILSALLYRIYNNKKDNQLSLIVISSILSCFSILATVLLSHIWLLSVILFLMHTLFCQIGQMAQQTLLQQSIMSESRRATIISVGNALDAVISVIILTINGFISDHMGIGSAWFILAIVGGALLILTYTVYLKSDFKS
ncbi:MFS transporter [Lactobacillus sp. ESL0679]|uniref:MFS transporter n=1 Tax=Lactobacillus sp. ESL0679 TaxID=2983209 RepID=UPI0023F98FF1|nr:MFS transporter [Lactobacillus sp. ESL0679]MDF7681957.1 MFS transporter [Lactobacillus sp. ESL0679]